MPNKSQDEESKEIIAIQPLPDRFEVIQRREQYWLCETQRERLIEDLFKLATEPVRRRYTSIAVNTSTGNGRTALAERYIYKHPPIVTPEFTQIPAISISMTGIFDIKKLLDKLLESILPKKVRLKDLPQETLSERLRRFVILAHKVQLGIVFLDNFQDCAKFDANTRIGGEPFFQVVRDLIDYGIHIVPMGLETLSETLIKDVQLHRRLNFKRGCLPPIDKIEDINKIMQDISLLEVIPHDAVSYVLSTTKGVVGNMLNLIEQTFIDTGNLSEASLKETQKLFDN